MKFSEKCLNTIKSEVLFPNNTTSYFYFCTPSEISFIRPDESIIFLKHVEITNTQTKNLDGQIIFYTSVNMLNWEYYSKHFEGDMTSILDWVEQELQILDDYFPELDMRNKHVLNLFYQTGLRVAY